MHTVLLLWNDIFSTVKMCNNDWYSVGYRSGEYDAYVKVSYPLEANIFYCHPDDIYVGIVMKQIYEQI